MDSIDIDIDTDFGKTLFEEATCDDVASLNNMFYPNNEVIIMHCNIRSIEANFKELEVFLHTLKFKPSIIFLSETWFIPHLGFFELDGYDLIYNASTITKADGTIAYVSKKMDCDTNIKDLGSLKIIEIATKSELFTAIYKNHKIKNNVFVDDLENYIRNNNHKNHYIFGDINIDILEKTQ